MNKKQNLFSHQSSSSRILNIKNNAINTVKSTFKTGYNNFATEQNSVNDALRKTRAGGYVPPPKTNGPIKTVVQTVAPSGPILMNHTDLTFTTTYANTGWGATPLQIFRERWTGTSGNYNWGANNYVFGAPTPNTNYSTIVSDVIVYGPWVQANLTNKTISLTSFSFFYFPNSNGIGFGAPVSITVVGSADNGATWTTIYTNSNATPYDFSLHTYTINSNQYYNSIRFIFTSINGGDASYIKGIYFSGYVLP